MWANLICACLAAVAVAQQSNPFHLTSSVANPAPVPGQPFTITWTNGAPTDPVFISLVYLFPNTPNQNIPYETTDILRKSRTVQARFPLRCPHAHIATDTTTANLPNNGSCTWNVPTNINAGRYYLTIGVNPITQSDSTPIFTITSSQTSGLSPAPSSTISGADIASYNGCGLPPVPYYTYTGYQPPCTTTVSGRVETLYPNVPASSSALFYGTSYLTASSTASSTTASTVYPAASPVNTAIASGPFAQALQCPAPVTPTPTTILAAGTYTVFATVGCPTPSAFPAVFASVSSTTTAADVGVCRRSGYSTFLISASIPATGSAAAAYGCCPSAWSTTPLAGAMYCYTALPAAKREVQRREAAVGTTPAVTLSGLAFTRAGVVAAAAVTATGGSSFYAQTTFPVTSSATTAAGSSASATGTVAGVASARASTSTTRSGGTKVGVGVWCVGSVLFSLTVLGLL